MNWILPKLWLIPALPLAAAAVSALLKREQRKAAAGLAIGAMSGALMLSCIALWGSVKEPSVGALNFRWFELGSDWVKLGWMLDPLTAVMLVMVTFVGLLIFVYSVGYMAHDGNFTRFFCFLSLFASAMLGVVIANSLLLLFVCWELVGLTSFLLIGFWYQKPSAVAAARKAFITTRVGDLALLMGMVWLYSETGTLLFFDAGKGCLETAALQHLVFKGTVLGLAVSTVIGLLVFIGAMGKSGQFPLHVWLPDAMEGPTPVSALIHAATMVAAGVFLVARVYPLMAATSSDFPSVYHSSQAGVRGQGPDWRLETGDWGRDGRGQGSDVRGQGSEQSGHEKGRGGAVSIVLKVVTWVGVFTALFAASIAVAQNDIKRILAYSTVSQLGFMMMGIGVGGVAVGMFHLITHAFFKALLFMGAGSVIHGCHDEQDIRSMGGLRRYMPVTFATYGVGMMALSGVPLLFSGFWSKDEIFHAAQGWGPSRWPFFLGMAAAFLTAFYMTRQMMRVFFGNYRPSPIGSAPHESPRVMTVPLVILAVFAMALGFLGTPAWPCFQSFLEGTMARFDLGRLAQPSVLGLMGLSGVIVFAGIGAGWWFYGRRPLGRVDEPDALERLQPGLFSMLRHKYYVDELYGLTFVRFNAWWANGCERLEQGLWARGVQVVSCVALGFGWINRLIDEYAINLGFDRVCRGLFGSGGWLSRLHQGRIQEYLRVIGIALAALVLMLIWGCGSS